MTADPPKLTPADRAVPHRLSGSAWHAAHLEVRARQLFAPYRDWPADQREELVQEFALLVLEWRTAHAGAPVAHGVAGALLRRIARSIATERVVSLETPWLSVPDCSETVEREALPTAISAALVTLTDRERRVLLLRFGLEDGRRRTLEAVGHEFGATRERIRQIEAKALKKLRHPSRADALAPWYLPPVRTKPAPKLPPVRECLPRRREERQRLWEQFATLAPEEAARLASKGFGRGR